MASLREELKSIETEWISLYNKKQGLFEESAERMGERAYGDKMVFVCLYKDQGLKELAFDEESFEYIDDRYFSKLSGYFTLEISRFKIENITKLAVEGFFQQRLDASPNSYDFFGRSAFELTDYQLSLMKAGNKFKIILDEVGGQIDPEDSPEEIEDYFYLKRAGLIKSELELAKEKSMWD